MRGLWHIAHGRRCRQLCLLSWCRLLSVLQSVHWRSVNMFECFEESAPDSSTWSRPPSYGEGSRIPRARNRVWRPLELLLHLGPGSRACHDPSTIAQAPSMEHTGLDNSRPVPNHPFNIRSADLPSFTSPTWIAWRKQGRRRITTRLSSHLPTRAGSRRARPAEQHPEEWLRV